MIKTKEEFAKYMNFKKIKSVKIKDVSLDEDYDAWFMPIDKEEFLKENLVELEMYWHESYELFFEDIDDLIEDYEDEYQEFINSLSR